MAKNRTGNRNLPGQPVRDRRGSFVRLAEKRVAAALRAIRLVGNLSNRSHYDFTDKDVRKIVSTLAAELEVSREVALRILERFIGLMLVEIGDLPRQAIRDAERA